MFYKFLCAGLITATILLSGCASYSYTDAPPTLGVLYSKYAYIGYEGELQNIHDVGIVTTDGLIKISTIDGKPLNQFRNYKTSGLYSGGRVQLHLLPGTHTLTMGFHDDRGSGTVSWSVSNVTKIISIKKGQVIHLWVSRDGRSWEAKESDGSKALETIISDYNELSTPR